MLYSSYSHRAKWHPGKGSRDWSSYALFFHSVLTEERCQLTSLSAIKYDNIRHALSEAATSGNHRDLFKMKRMHQTVLVYFIMCFFFHFCCFPMTRMYNNILRSISLPKYVKKNNRRFVGLFQLCVRTSVKCTHT